MPILSESRFNAYNQLSVVTLMMVLGFNINDILKNMSKLKSDNEEGVEVILWHYDADYEFLNHDSIERIIIIGPRSKDIYVRSLLAGIDSSKLFVFENQKDAHNYITTEGIDTLFLLNDMYIEKEASQLKEYIIETF